MFKIHTLLDLVAKHVRHGDYDFATSYGERGYSDPERGIIFANWNDCPKWLMDGLERRGFELEWSDEWIISYETNKAYRTSPDSHGWTPYYYITDDGEVIGGDEIENDRDLAETYINEHLLNNSQAANVFKLDLASFGFKQHNSDFETGWHPGQNDDPRKVLKYIQETQPRHDVVFTIGSVGQFDSCWQCWIRSQIAFSN